jgi:hypothetical protein
VAVVDMIVGCAFAESEMILCCGFAEGSMILGGGVIVASEMAAVHMILRCMIVADVTVGGGYTMGDMILRGYTVGDIILRGGYAVAVIILLISPTTRSARA